MNDIEKKCLDWSVLGYRRLIRAYPEEFRKQFDVQLAQTFGDLARRAVESGSYLCLANLWMRTLLDFASSVLRERLAFDSVFGISAFRRRWILACGFGFALGWLGINGLKPDLWGTDWRLTRFIANTLCIGIALGGLQSKWALNLGSVKVRRWVIGTSLAFAFPIAHGLFSTRVPLMPLGALIVVGISGATLGATQALLLKPGRRVWSWIPVNVVAFWPSWFIANGLALWPKRSGIVPGEFAYLLGYFLGGLTFGFLTSWTLERIVSPVVESNAQEVTE